MNKSHDQAYKLLFSEPELMIDLLQGFVQEDWVKELDFNSLEKVSGSFVSDDLRSREDDLIWRVKFQNEWIYVYLLIEFQSTIDRFMAVRLMSYIGLLYQDLIKSKQLTTNKQLPPVFPVVLYNGDQRWTAATELKDLIVHAPGGLEHYLPSLKYLLLDEGAYDTETLAPLKNLVAAIFRLENAQTDQEILAVITNLIEWLQAPEQTRIRRNFSVWIKRVLLSSQEMEVKSKVTDLLEIKTMLANRIPQWIKEGEARGEARGEAKTLIRQLTLKFGSLTEAITTRIYQAEKEELDLWVERVLTAVTLDDVFH